MSDAAHATPALIQSRLQRGKVHKPAYRMIDDVDGGLYAFRSELATGRVIEEKRVCHEELVQRDKLLAQASRYDDYYTDGTISAVLVAQGNSSRSKIYSSSTEKSGSASSCNNAKFSRSRTLVR